MGGRFRPLLIALAALLALSSMAYGAERRERSAGRGDRLLDVREGARAHVSGGVRDAQRGLRRRLGRGGLLRVEPRTGTPRFVTDLSGSLTARSSLAPGALARRFLRDQRRAYGLDEREAESVDPEHEYRSPEGITYVRLRQTYRGVPAFDGSLTAAVRDGRLLSVAGAPRRDLAVPSTNPRLSAARAREVAQRDAGVDSRARRAKRVLFDAPRGTRLAWSLIVHAGTGPVFSTVIDASSGDVLRRANLVKRATTGRALDHNPAAAAGNTYAEKNFAPYIDGANNRLRGRFAYTYADPNGVDDSADTPIGDGGTQVPPSGGSGTAAAKWDYAPTTEGSGLADPPAAARPAAAPGTGRRSSPRARSSPP